MASKKNVGLGKGLDALFSSSGVKDAKKTIENVRIDGPAEDGILKLSIDVIKPNPDQPRKVFSEERLQDLADSIKEHGLIQPIAVQKRGNVYEIVAGERRWRAAHIAGIKELPCVVLDIDDTERALLAIIENMQREDLNPIEEAEGIQNMMEKYGMTQEEVAKTVSKSRSYIANSLRLLNLAEKPKEMLQAGSLTAGHARALLSLPKKKQESVADLIVKQGMSVRAVEGYVEGYKPRKTATAKEKNPEISRVERDLKTALGTRVSIKKHGNKGKIEIEFYSVEELDRLVTTLLDL